MKTYTVGRTSKKIIHPAQNIFTYSISESRGFKVKYDLNKDSDHLRILKYNLPDIDLSVEKKNIIVKGEVQNFENCRNQIIEYLVDIVNGLPGNSKEFNAIRKSSLRKKIIHDFLTSDMIKEDSRMDEYLISSLNKLGIVYSREIEKGDKSFEVIGLGTNPQIVAGLPVITYQRETIPIIRKEEHQLMGDKENYKRECTFRRLNSISGTDKLVPEAPRNQSDDLKQLPYSIL
jgi:hypothetical protein